MTNNDRITEPSIQVFTEEQKANKIGVEQKTPENMSRSTSPVDDGQGRPVLSNSEAEEYRKERRYLKEHGYEINKDGPRYYAHQ